MQSGEGVRDYGYRCFAPYDPSIQTSHDNEDRGLSERREEGKENKTYLAYIIPHAKTHPGPVNRALLNEVTRRLVSTKGATEYRGSGRPLGGRAMMCGSAAFQEHQTHTHHMRPVHPALETWHP